MIGGEQCSGKKELRREKRGKEEGKKKNKREKKRLSSLFGFSKPDFILLSIFWNEISFLRIFVLVYNFKQILHFQELPSQYFKLTDLKIDSIIMKYF